MRSTTTTLTSILLDGKTNIVTLPNEAPREAIAALRYPQSGHAIF